MVKARLGYRGKIGAGAGGASTGDPAVCKGTFTTRASGIDNLPKS